MESLSLILGEVNEVMGLIEQYSDPATGEVLEIPPEIEARLNSSLSLLSKKIDNIGFSIVMQDKEIEGYKAIKALVDIKIRSKQKSQKRFKAYLAKIIRQLGTQNDKGVYSLKGNIVTAKDNSGFEYEIDKETLKELDQHEYQDIIIKFPRDLYDKNLSIKKSIDKIAETISFELNEDRLKADYDKEFNELNSIKDGITEESLAISLPKDKIKYPAIIGIKKIWVDKTTFLGLKKLDVGDTNAE
jgi:hypothetical protein